MKEQEKKLKALAKKNKQPEYVLWQDKDNRAHFVIVSKMNIVVDVELTDDGKHYKRFNQMEMSDCKYFKRCSEIGDYYIQLDKFESVEPSKLRGVIRANQLLKMPDMFAKEEKTEQMALTFDAPENNPRKRKKQEQREEILQTN